DERETMLAGHMHRRRCSATSIAQDASDGLVKTVIRVSIGKRQFSVDDPEFRPMYALSLLVALSNVALAIEQERGVSNVLKHICGTRGARRGHSVSNPRGRRKPTP